MREKLDKMFLAMTQMGLCAKQHTTQRDILEELERHEYFGYVYYGDGDRDDILGGSAVLTYGATTGDTKRSGFTDLLICVAVRLAASASGLEVLYAGKPGRWLKVAPRNDN